MKIYNTLSKKKENFVPKDKNNVKMYTCGPTVYDYAHIGNLRTYIFEDIFEKTLIYLGYKVNRVMNITDVGHLTSDADTGEDKMEKGAIRENKSVLEIAEKYTESFFEDLKKLNIKKPNIVSKASDNIDQYIKIIEKLIVDDYAYISNGNIYFDISKASNYYQLSNQKDLMVGARDDVEEDKNKRNPFDFVLWFTSSKFDNHSLKWDSPWGEGYPGWHIECSGICLKHFGEYVDVHCGAVDNIFPHHSNEIAQSEAYLGHQWCNYWVHGEFLTDKSGKMSKSKGEFLTLNLLISKGFNPLAYRYFCLGSHYRKQLEFTYESLEIAQKAYLKLLQKVKNLSEVGNVDREAFDLYKDKFKSALRDDLNTSNALTVLYEVLNEKKLSDKTKKSLILDFDQVLSLNLNQNNDLEINSEIKELIELRETYKNNKQYDKADKIRETLLLKNIVIKDTKDGPIIENKE